MIRSEAVCEKGRVRQWEWTEERPTRKRKMREWGERETKEGQERERKTGQCTKRPTQIGGRLFRDTRERDERERERER